MWIYLKYICTNPHILLHRGSHQSFLLIFFHPYTLYFKDRSLEINRRSLMSCMVKIKITDYPAHSWTFPDSTESQPRKLWKQLRTLYDRQWRRRIQAQGLLLEWASARCVNRLLNNLFGGGRRKGKGNPSLWRFISPNCTSHNPNVASACVRGALVLGLCASAEFPCAEPSSMGLCVPLSEFKVAALHKVLTRKKGRHACDCQGKFQGLQKKHVPLFFSALLSHFILTSNMIAIFLGF